MVQKVKAGTPHFAEGVAVPSQVGKSKEDWIGNQFRRIYDEALEDDIPNDMMDLLSQLDNISASQDSSDDQTDSDDEPDKESSN
ncbi:NepR family anti-sigma factor [Roseibium limicola]|uniref:Anti-sigma factor NepR domain-containing protein n=1 Tax=Roseibium limicola TaxID=2816037 RepID=A0A939ERR3_9HYPH|nr:NepR family anti-sigma factor [Roseibium limicola]MBO0347352.1 hypothetical protein [Roseibium limicola]